MRATLCLCLASACLLGARPYEDTKKRFALSLPETWKLSPAFGDTFGMRFVRELEGGGRLTLTVHVDPVEADGIGAFAKEIGGWVEEQGARRVSERRAEFGAHPAVVYDYESAPTARTSFASRSYFLEVGEHFYHLYFTSAPPRVFKTAKRELDLIVGSFQPKAAPSPTAPPPVEQTPKGELIGAWIGEGGARLVLTSEGTFRLQDVSGRYVLEGQRLALLMPGGRSQQFQATVRGDSLMLESDKLPKPAIYRRARSGTEGATDARIEGHWVAQVPGGTLTLDLEASGQFSLEGTRGQWALKEGRLILTGDGGAEAIYDVRVQGQALFLSGGDLEKPVKFLRGAPK